jgi:hypothetical protein
MGKRGFEMVRRSRRVAAMKKAFSRRGFLAGAMLSPLLSVCRGIQELPGGIVEGESVDLFVSGQDGYHTFRIPALIAVGKETLLAFCEGRRQGGSDSGDIDLVMRRSADGGRTCLAECPGGAYGCLYERGTSSPYERITLAWFGLV